MAHGPTTGHTRGMSYPRPAPQPAAGTLRASHADRDRAVEQLKVAYTDGRLDREEFDLRLHAALSAVTREDADAVLAGLGRAPSAVPAAPLPHRRPNAHERGWAMLAHVPGVLPSLLVLLLRGRESGFVRAHAVEGLNFQLTLVMLSVIFPLALVLTLGLIMLFYIAMPFMIAAGVLTALAGARFRYPLSVRLVR